MKFKILITFIVVCSMLVVGCQSTSTSDIVEDSELNQHDVNETTGEKVDKNSDLSRYYLSSQKGDSVVTDNQINWKSGNATFTAEKSSSSITSMNVENGDEKFKVSVPENNNPNDISSVELSADQSFLAIEVFYENVGSKVLIVNLSNGENTFLDDEINADAPVETIHAYSWSPQGNQLAFSYGDTSTSKLAIFDLDAKKIKNLPDVEEIINTLYIMWNKNGESIDFISEYQSDQFNLYRYTFDDNQIQLINEVSREELSNYNPFQYGL